MIALLMALSACAGAGSTCVRGQLGGAPATIVIATSRGEFIVPVTEERGHPALPAPYLSGILPLTTEIRAEWAVATFAGQPFRFLLGAPAFVHADRVIPLAGGAYVVRDTLFLPLQWLTGYLPTVFSESYRYDASAGRFEEISVTPVIASAPAPVARARVAPAPVAPARAPARRSSRLPVSGVLRRPHSVVVDAGHGGVDPGNPGLHFPGNMHEKDVNLAVAKLLRKELENRGIEVVMTRTRDTLIALEDRGRFCTDECDLFLSIHVNSLPRRRGYENISGIETYFLAAARTEDADRVARMENEAVRYDTGYQPGKGDDPLQFILKDLQANEYLRESAVLADLIQNRAGRIHPGGDRGVSQAGFMVLTTARRPAVLVETGFSTNRVDSRFLVASDGQLKLAQAIADAVVEYLRQHENKVAFEAEP